MGRRIIVVGVLFGYYIGGEGRPGRPAGWAQILVRNAPILVENGPIFDQIGRIPIGGRHIVCSQHSSTAASSVGSTQEAPLFCLRQQTPVVGPHHAALFATADSSGRTTSRSLCCNNRLLWWHHSTFLCWYYSRRSYVLIAFPGQGAMY